MSRSLYTTISTKSFRVVLNVMKESVGTAVTYRYISGRTTQLTNDSANTFIFSAQLLAPNTKVTTISTDTLPRTTRNLAMYRKVS